MCCKVCCLVVCIILISYSNLVFCCSFRALGQIAISLCFWCCSIPGWDFFSGWQRPIFVIVEIWGSISIDLDRSFVGSVMSAAEMRA